MFDCPNCGEPVDDSASFCSNCGSDAETGWNPAADYLSLELPDDDEYEADHGLAAYVDDPIARLRNMLGPVVMALCFILFVTVGYKRYGLWIILPALYLMVTSIVVLRVLGRPVPRRDGP